MRRQQRTGLLHMRASDGLRVSVRLIQLILITALVAGCSASAPSGPRPTGSTLAGPELKVGFAADPYMSEGPGISLGMYPLNSNIFETLVSLKPDYEVEPRLADRWEFHPPNTWRFFLHRGVRFHDGHALDAEAVKVGLFDRVAKSTASTIVRLGSGSANVVDRYTIDFTPVEPDMRLPQQLANPRFGVAAPGSDLGKKPIGTGPFRFVEYRPGAQLVVERNPEYWGAIQPSLSRIRFRFYSDPALRAKALEGGEISFAYSVRRQDVQELRQKDFQVIPSPIGGSAAVLIRINGSPPDDVLSDVNVRKAIAYAIDRPAASANVLYGLDGTQQSFIPPLAIAPYGGQVKGYYLTRNDAEAMLEASGWSSGPDGIRRKGARRLHLTLVSGFPDSQTEVGLASFLQDALKRVGIDLAIVGAPDANAYQARLSDGQGDLYLEERHQEDGDPLSFALRFYSRSSERSSYATLFGPRGTFDTLIASALIDPDMGKLREATTAAVRELVDVQAVVLPLGGMFDLYAMSSSVQGLIAHPSPAGFEWNRVVLL